MDHNSDQSESIKDELVFFGGIINQLLQSKKIIIVTTLVFTISLFFYTLQQENIYKSSALIEIGSYQKADNVKKLIVPISKLTKNFNIDNLKKKYVNNTPIIVKPKSDSLFTIETQSTSIEKNNIAINQIIDEIVNQHKDIFVTITHNNFDKQTININKLNDRQSLLDNQISVIEQFLIEIEDIANRMKSNPNLSMDHYIEPYASITLALYNAKTILIENKYHRQKLIQEKNILESQLDNHLLSYTDTKLVNEIESTAINLNLKTYAVFQGLILGFIISIFFVLINNFIKTYRRT
jgi:LPS O-antigen subunit length determinant protein (WzzB/FepE family)